MPRVPSEPQVSVPLEGPLRSARFVARPNRFLVHCALEDGLAGSPVEAHLADPGRLKELLIPGRRIWVRPASNPARRTRWSVALVEAPAGEGLVSVDTNMPNRLVHEALRRSALSELAGWELERAEAPLGRSRIDFLLRSRAGRRLALEVKSVTLVEDGVGLFPDAITARGARHLRELAALARQDEWDAAVLFVVQRADARRIHAAAHIDAEFARALAEARSAGVRVLGRRCVVGPDRLALGEAVPAD